MRFSIIVSPFYSIIYINCDWTRIIPFFCSKFCYIYLGVSRSLGYCNNFFCTIIIIIILSKGNTYPGDDDFKKSDDVVQVKAPVVILKDKVETFTMQFAKVKNESCELHLMWGNTDIAVPITTNIKDRIRAQIEAALQGDKKPYSQAANFYYEYDKNYAKALENINKATAENPKAFFLFLQKARIQRDMGDKAGAKESAMKTIELSKEAKNADYENFGNQLLKQL